MEMERRGTRHAMNHQRHAFVSWIIRDPSYLAGVLVLGSSLRFHCPGIQRICLLSRDIAQADVLGDLKLVFDWVVIVDLIYAEARHPTWTRFEHMYEDWINYCFTRLQCLRLGKVLGIDKILVFDADCLVISDLSDLFELPTPAGCLSPGRVPISTNTLEFYQEPSGAICHEKLHGKKIPSSAVSHAVATDYGVRGCLLLLSPNDEDFVHLINVLKSRPSKLPNAIGSYGDEKFHIGPDERHLTEVMQERYGWTHIHQRYCMTAWHLDKLKFHEIPKCLHFVSKKPWDTNGEYFEDFGLWYLEALHLLSLHPSLEKRFMSSFLQTRDKQNNCDFHLLGRMGISKFWDSQISSQLRMLPEFHLRSKAIQWLSTETAILGRVLQMPTHEIYSVQTTPKQTEKNRETPSTEATTLPECALKKAAAALTTRISGASMETEDRRNASVESSGSNSLQSSTSFETLSRQPTDRTSDGKPPSETEGKESTAKSNHTPSATSKSSPSSQASRPRGLISSSRFVSRTVGTVYAPSRSNTDGTLKSEKSLAYGSGDLKPIAD